MAHVDEAGPGRTRPASVAAAASGGGLHRVHDRLLGVHADTAPRRGPWRHGRVSGGGALAGNERAARVPSVLRARDPIHTRGQRSRSRARAEPLLRHLGGPGRRAPRGRHRPSHEGTAGRRGRGPAAGVLVHVLDPGRSSPRSTHCIWRCWPCACSRCRPSPRDRRTTRLAVFFAVYACAFGNHLGMILLLVPFTVFLVQVHPRPRELLAPSTVLLAIAIAVAGALQYAPTFFFVWSSIDAPPNWSDRVAAFWLDVTKADWREQMVLGISSRSALGSTAHVGVGRPAAIRHRRPRPRRPRRRPSVVALESPGRFSSVWPMRSRRCSR